MIDSAIGFRRSVHRVVLVALLSAGGLGAASLLAGCSDGTDSTVTGPTPTSTEATDDGDGTTKQQGVTHEFVIPDGASVRVANGEIPEVIPSQIDVDVGDTMEVRNEDIETARLGIFDVGPGETVTMNFTEANVLVGTKFGDEPAGCGPPPSPKKKFVINVRP